MLANLKISKIQKCFSCLHSLNILVSISHKSKAKISVSVLLSLSFNYSTILSSVQICWLFSKLSFAKKSPGSCGSFFYCIQRNLWIRKKEIWFFPFVLNILEFFNVMLRTFLCFFKTKEVESLKMVYYICMTCIQMLYFICIHTVGMRKVLPHIFPSLIWLFGYCSSACGLTLKF